MVDVGSVGSGVQMTAKGSLGLGDDRALRHGSVQFGNACGVIQHGSRRRSASSEDHLGSRNDKSRDLLARYVNVLEAPK
jgi:hypothetical protein